MLSGVATLNVAKMVTLREVLDRARDSVEHDVPLAVYCRSDYGSAWFTQHRASEEWMVHSDVGYTMTAKNFSFRRSDEVDKMIGSGEWYYMTHGRSA